MAACRQQRLSGPDPFFDSITRLDPAKLYCQIPKCPDFGVGGKGNIHHQGRSGQWKLLHCRTCDRTFSERRYYPLYPARLPAEQTIRILLGLTENESIRGLAEKEGLDKMTVHAFVRRAEERRKPLQAWLTHDQQLGRALVRKISDYLAHRHEVKRKNRFA